MICECAMRHAYAQVHGSMHACMRTCMHGVMHQLAFCEGDDDDDDDDDYDDGDCNLSTYRSTGETATLEVRVQASMTN